MSVNEAEVYGEALNTDYLYGNYKNEPVRGFIFKASDRREWRKIELWQ